MGGKRSTTTSKVTIPPEVLARYNAVNARAETAAATPYQAFGNTASDYVAQMNAQQYAGIADINAKAGSYQPYLDQATSATQAGMGPAYAGIDNYMSPYIKNVADTTGAYMRQQQEQAQSGALGTAAMSGAFGGDRAGIAAANLQQQNQMGYGKTMADIMNQGYTQALGASQADLARQLQGGSQMAELGAQSQQLGLQGAQAKIAAGTMEQQTEQAGKDAMINQFMQEKGYPFQVAQFLANIAMGTGAASGSTTATTAPRNWMGFADGGGVSGPRTYSQGQIGGQGYVPAGDLPVGQLMVADPPQEGQSNGMDEMIKIIEMVSGMASGGVAGGRHGYATDGGVEDLGNRIRLDDLLIEQFGGVKPVVSDGKDGKLGTGRGILGTNPQYPGSRVLAPMTTEQLRNRVNDPDYYDFVGFQTARNLSDARTQAETNPANMGYGAGQNMGNQSRVYPYPPSPTTGVVAPAAPTTGVVAPTPAATLPTFKTKFGSKLTLNPDGSSSVAYPDGTVEQLIKYDTDKALEYHGTTAEELRASQTPAPATTGVAARGPIAALQISPEEKAADRAMMARALGAREPRANERYMLPTGLVRPPGEALETLDFGAMLNAEDTTPVPVIAPTPTLGTPPRPPTMVDMEPVPSQFFGNITRDTRGNLYAENGTRMITDPDEKNIAAREFSNEMKRRALVAEQKTFEAGDSPLFLADAFQAGQNVRDAKEAEAQAQANLGDLPLQRPTYSSRFDVPAGSMPAAPPPRYEIPTGLGSPTAFGLPPLPTPTGGVVVPAMTARPSGVQQPMAFTAGEKPSPAPAADLGTPPNSGLAPTTSPRPPARPADLGTPPAVAEPELGAGIIVGNRMTPAPEGIGYDIDRLAAAVRFQESGSPSGNYGVLGAPVEREGGRTDRAYGAYQIMGDNIPQWTKEILGYSMTPEEFLRDPQAQDTVAKAKLDQMYQQHGSIEDVASVWFSGRPLNNNNSVDKTSGKTVPSYVSDVMNKYYGGGEGSPTNYSRGSVNEGVPSFDGGLGGADMARQRDGLPNRDKPYDQRNFLGKFFRNEDGSLNTNALLSVLMGVGKAAEAQTISPLGGILSGIGGGAEAYKGLTKQAADVAQTQALTNQTNIEAAAARFRVGPDGMPMVIMPDGSNVDYYTFKNSPELQAKLGSAQTAAIVKAAEAAGVAAAASAPDAAIYSTPEVQNAFNNELVTLRSLQGDRSSSNTIVSNINNAAAAAGGNMRANTFMQFNAFAGLNGNPPLEKGGYQAGLRANIAKALDLLGSTVGLERDSSFAAETDIIKKAASILGTEAASNLDQGTLGALQEIMQSLPNADQDPKASAKLMASIIQSQQRAIDLKNWNDGYISRENGNPTMTAFGSEAKFNDNTAQLYEQEKPYLEALVLKGGDPSTADPASGMTPVQMLTSGQLNPQETADVLSQLFPQGYPSHLVTTFSR
jgi:hypothetical protein